MIGGAEGMITDNQYFTVFIWLAINILLCYLCKHTISYREWYKLSGNQLMDSFIK
jgi:hypothetical protein